MRGPENGGISQADNRDVLLGRLVQSLMESAEHPPSEVQGVSDEFIEQLERVPKKALKAEMSCPICSNAFLDGMDFRPVRQLLKTAKLTNEQTFIHSSSGCLAIKTTFLTSNAYSHGSSSTQRAHWIGKRW